MLLTEDPSYSSSTLCPALGGRKPAQDTLYNLHNRHPSFRALSPSVERVCRFQCRWKDWSGRLGLDRVPGGLKLITGLVILLSASGL